MDVKQYYRKLREVEAKLTEPYVLIVSLETSDGGKSGAVCEVTRAVAAKMIVEGRATLATQSDQDQYRQEQAAAKKAAQKAELARRVQVAIIADRDLDNVSTERGSKSPNNGGK